MVTHTSSLSSWNGTSSTAAFESISTPSNTTLSIYGLTQTPYLSSKAITSASHFISSTSYTTSAPPTSVNRYAGVQINSGGLAGAIIGSFLGGIVLASLVAALFFRRRNNTAITPAKNDSVGIASAKPKDIGDEGLKVPNSYISPLQNGMIGMLDLSPYVPPAADDFTVCSRIQTFFDQASLHIDNYYSCPNSNIQSLQKEGAAIHEYDSLLLGSSLEALLSGSKSQRGILTHTLLYALLKRIQPGSNKQSLIPPCFELETNTSYNDSVERTVFAWRMLTSFLYTQSHRSQVASSDQDDIISLFAEDFTEKFASYSDNHFSQAARLSHLANVTCAAADLGKWLLSQPCFFEFRWSKPDTAVNQIVILPAVVKTCDEQGKRLLSPRVLLEEVRRIV